MKLLTENGLAKKFYHDYRLIAALPAICVIIDYALTFFLAGDTSMITSWEASPFVRFAVINNLMIPYLIAIVLFYYGASYAVLRILSGTEFYKFGVIHFRNAMYSNSVMILSMLSIVVAFIVFGFSLVREHGPASP